MLHITNGDCAAEPIRRTGIGGEVISWGDVLHEGPVPEVANLREVRARFFDQSGWPSYEEALRHFEARDRKVAAAGEVTLWFEHDLFDQLQLLEALNALRGQPVWLIQSGEYLGHLSVEQLAALYPARRRVTKAQYDLAARAWAAFRSPDPTAIERVLASDTGALPYLAAALTRHLEQFPSLRNGLARTERQILRAIQAGAHTRTEVFLADQKFEDALFMGDTSFWRWLDRLVTARTPLAVERDGKLELTPAGRAVLAGEADHVELNGIDRWLGGVHLTQDQWRWDERALRLAQR